MDNQHNKKQRNQRRQKDNKNIDSEIKDVKGHKPSESVDSSKGFDPRPQRANRRQQNEPKPSSNPVDTSSSITEVRKEPVVQNVVDHSNLKKETEEIAKLTKKFNKREISSNWHRYSAPEQLDNGNRTEDDAPADFSDLLQMPLSRGGHLQLKEEQDWSTASGAELSGYFALDLKLLSQGLACIPIHEQLRLPKHIFTEEEVQHFASQADHYKTCYNTEITENPSKNAPKKNKDIFNILDIEGSTQRLLNIVDESENESNNLTLSHDIKNSTESNANISNNNTNVLLKEKLETRKDDLNLEPTKNKQEVSLTLEKLISKQPPQEVVVEGEKQNVEDKFQEDQLVLSKPVPRNECDSLLIIGNKELSLNIQESVDNTAKALGKDVTVPLENFAKLHLEVKPEIEYHTTSHSKETNQKPQRVSKNKGNPVKEVNSNNNSALSKDVSLGDDDDDLDFLLTLKTPVTSQENKDNTRTPIKESSFLPKASTTSTSKATTQELPSELDDWLDSVLED